MGGEELCVYLLEYSSTAVQTSLGSCKYARPAFVVNYKCSQTFEKPRESIPHSKEEQFIPFLILLFTHTPSPCLFLGHL